MKLKGKIALVTGSSTGLGRAIVLGLAAAGRGRRHQLFPGRGRRGGGAESRRGRVCRSHHGPGRCVRSGRDRAAVRRGRRRVRSGRHRGGQRRHGEGERRRSPTSPRRTSTCCTGSTPRGRTSSCARQPGGSPTTAGSSRSRPTRRRSRSWVSACTAPARSRTGYLVRVMALELGAAGNHRQHGGARGRSTVPESSPTRPTTNTSRA